MGKLFENQENNGLAKQEYERLRNQPRFKSDGTLLFGHRFRLVDATTFLNSYDEIFIGEIYKFNPKKKSDILIIDCGANIGLATLYFKRKFPGSKIIAYEADPNIFNVMKDNVSSFGYTDVSVINEAISDKDGEINFHLEGGHSGMIVQNADQSNVVPVRSIRLKNVLNQFDEITFLKIDIEGHETNVIFDIGPELQKVQYLFLEYHSFMHSEQQLGEILNTITRAGMRYYLKEA